MAILEKPIKEMCHGHTYSMHPLVLAFISSAIAEYNKIIATGLPQRVSKYLESKLRELSDRHESMGDVRGIGHFWAIELARDRKTKEPFNVKNDESTDKVIMTDKISTEALKRGMYIHNWHDHFTISPPSIITEKEVDEGVQILGKLLVIAYKGV